MTSPLISADELLALQGSADAGTLRVLDARWQLGRSDGREQYLAGHIPGAVFVDVENELAGHGAPEEGRHPLPSEADFQVAARRWGIDQRTAVVVYDDARMLPASRLWWALRRAGISDVRVLDGGWQQWLAAGGTVETGDVTVPAGTVSLADAASDDVIGTDGAAQWPAHGVLVDVRAAERYRGESEPIDPRAGHIPGARNLPIGDLLDADGRFRPPEELVRAFDDVGANDDIPIAAYCGSGITAAQFALAGAVIGRDVTVYPGSWSAWSNTSGLPVATGEDAGEPARGSAADID